MEGTTVRRLYHRCVSPNRDSHHLQISSHFFSVANHPVQCQAHKRITSLLLSRPPRRDFCKFDPLIYLATLRPVESVGRELSCPVPGICDYQ